MVNHEYGAATANLESPLTESKSELLSWLKDEQRWYLP